MTKKTELRKVKLTKYDDGSGGHSINGYFHEWGKFTHYTDNGAFQVTQAIVELEDGATRGYGVHRVKFVDNF